MRILWRSPRALGWFALTMLLFAAVSGLAQGRGYRVGAGDVLKVTVWGHDDLTRPVVVPPDGTVPFPLIGDIRVLGLTTGQIELRLKDLLGRDYLVDPQVSVVVQEYRSQRVFVLGEVAKPGTYALTGQLSLLDIFSQAGGPTKVAGRDILVVRAPAAEGPAAPGAAGTTTVRVNLGRLLDGDAAENLALESGDTIYLPKQVGIFLLGEVRRPGAYGLERDTTALEAITMAGGLTERAVLSAARLLRKKSDGTQETTDVDLTGSKARETLLSDGDTLLIPAGNTFYVLGEVRKPGAYQLEQATTAVGGIALAGGFTEKAAPNRTKIIRTRQDGRQETLAVDLNDVLKRGRKDKDVPLAANDVIVVPESFF